jgi:hypothetical protein
MKRWYQKLLIYLLIVLIAFVGISACFSGPLLIIDPSGKLIQFSEGTLDNTPFPNFLIPGIILTVVIGLYPILVTIWLLFPKVLNISVAGTLQPRWYAAMSVGIAIMIFIIVQIIFIPERMFLQDVYLIIGLLICTVCLSPAIMKYYSNEKKSIS